MTAPHYHSHVDDPAAVGRRLKEARLAAGLSQRQLSFPGCSAAYISRLEAGDRVPSLQLLRKLAHEAERRRAVPRHRRRADRAAAARADRGRGRAPTRRAGDPSRARRTSDRPTGSTTRRIAGPRPLGRTRARSRVRGDRAARGRISPATRSRCSTTRTTAAPARSIAPMEHRALGRSGVDVSRIILGCGNFGGIGSSPAFFGAGETEGEAHALMDAAWEAGITTFDTADAYGGGRSESFIGSWLRSQGPDVRDRIVLTTKTFNPMSRGRRPRPRPGERIRRQIDDEPRAARRRRASTSTSPTRWIRRRRSRRPIGAFDELVARGQDPRLRRQQRRRRLARGSAPARPPGLGAELATRCSSATTRASVLPLCAREGLGYTPFSPLAGGWLTGKYRRGEEPPAGSRMTHAARAVPPPAGRPRLRRARGVRGDARTSAATTPAALAIAWLLGDPHVTAVVVGPRRPEQLRPALEALELDLSPAEREQLAALFA